MRILTSIRNRRFRKTVGSQYVGPVAPILSIVFRLAITLALTVLPTVGTLSAQPKSPEIFSTVGTLWIGSDEGALGRVVSYGGGFIVPTTERMYIGFDFETAQIRKIRSNDDFYIRRSTLVIPNVCFRWGNEKAYAYVGAGVGAEHVDSRSRADYFDPETSLPGHRTIRLGVLEFGFSEWRRILFAPKIGFVAFPVDRIGVKVDFGFANYHTGLRVGVVYRIGR
ncbi:MAG: hypothetical protein OXH11_17240 [Candidatus Aminicenantes bacterium]|nr:hypothetical protein [Candidatus Aminicenantes bacterium]